MSAHAQQPHSRDAHTIVALIPARGGSKGLARKNLARLGGKPLLQWSVAAGLASTYVNDVIVSTEDPRIADAARHYGAQVPYMRPDALARDDSPTMPVVFDMLRRTPRCTLVVLLPPTSPLRTVADIDGCIELALRRQRAVVSVCTADPPPAHMLVKTPQGIAPLLESLPTGGRRQELAEVFALNGAVYVATPSDLHEHGTFVSPQTLLYTMPKARSVDVDDEVDLQIAQALLAGRDQARAA